MTIPVIVLKPKDREGEDDDDEEDEDDKSSNGLFGGTYFSGKATRKGEPRSQMAFSQKHGEDNLHGP